MNQFSGLMGAAAANLLWGLSPLYYKQLGTVSPAVLLCAQVVLTFAVLAVFQGFRISDARLAVLRQAAPTAILIGLNWTAYVVAVMHGQALQASYAYFMAPILTVLLGSFVFGEPLPLRQKAGLALSAGAVLLDVVHSSEVPYLGALIAIPFAAYMVLHKRLGSRNAVSALKTETMLLAPFALVGLALLAHGPATATIDQGALGMLALIGVVNAFPLLLFIRSAPSLSASQLGASQFIAPITSAVLSYVAFGAALSPARCVVLVLLACGMACAVWPPKAATA